MAEVFCASDCAMSTVEESPTDLVDGEDWRHSDSLKFSPQKPPKILGNGDGLPYFVLVDYTVR